MNVLKLKKSIDLKQICVNCGVAQTGTKTVLIERLLNAPVTRLPPRLLSMDVGIKNLAVCELELNNCDDFKPAIAKWTVFDFPATSFDQPFFAISTLEFIRKLQPLPAIVLIERQRMRSQGLGNVPEWIARMNMLDAMLHTAIQAPNVQMDTTALTVNSVSIDPAKVMKYWFREDVSQSRNPNERYRMTKGSKTKIVSEWLQLPESNRPFLLDEGLDTQYFSEQAKKDDLSDALLQGLAWVRWQHNIGQLRRAIGSAEELDCLKLWENHSHFAPN